MKLTFSLVILSIIFGILYIWSPINITINRVSKSTELAVNEHIRKCEINEKDMAEAITKFVENWRDSYQQHVGACNKNVVRSNKNLANFDKWFKIIQLYWDTMEPDIAATIEKKVDFVKLRK